MEILFILFLTLLNALFAMSELAMSTARKVRLNAMAEAGDKGAAAALKLAEEPTRMLSTVQVGITSIGLLNGIVGEAAFAAGVAAQLQTWGTPEALARPIATFSVVVVLAYITLIFGEMVPKEVQDKVLAKKAAIIDGKEKVFVGPIKDQSGTVRIAEGVVAPDADLLSMDWFVQGVVGTTE